MLAIAGADATLMGWGRRHPDAAIHLDWLGQRLLRRGHPDLARRAFDNALAIDPALPPAREGAAAVHERYGEFPAAHTLLTGLIDEAAKRRDREDLTHLATWYLRRAGTSTLWAKQLLLAGAEAARPAIDQLREALDDLGHSAQAVQPMTTEHAYAVHAARIETLFTLGEARACNGDNDASNQDFDEARRILDSVLEPMGPDQRKQHDKLALELEMVRARSRRRPAPNAR
jgi:hypothetical protein